MLGGGASIHGSPRKNFALKVSRPVKGKKNVRPDRWWVVGVRRGDSNKWFLRVTVICAKVG